MNAESGKRYSPDSHATLGTRSLNLLAFCDQNMSKSSPTDENIAQLAEQALRRYLIRCHRTVSDEYPEIKNMEPEKAADFLLHLRRSGRIDIQLYMKDQNRIGCRITERGAGAGPACDD